MFVSQVITHTVVRLFSLCVLCVRPAKCYGIKEIGIHLIILFP